MCAWILAALLAAPAALAQPFLPLDQVASGQRGTGKTVFQGTTIEDFDVEILGVLENVGPKQSLILARLSGGLLERAGVMAGMSGSPVYIDGRLIGAVAFSFPFSTEPLCGIRPIEDMLAAAPVTSPAARADLDLAAMLDGSNPLLPARPAAPPGALQAIATPVSFGGFSERTLEVFGDQLRALGLRPLQGVGGQARRSSNDPIAPGSMISVGLIRGDLSVVAAGTVTHVDGDRLYAFGHSFLAGGPTELPMMRSSVIAVAPTLDNSFKLAGSGDLIGKITLDRSAGVAGALGPGPDLIPASILVRSPNQPDRAYQLELVRGRFLTPFLLQIASFSAIDATERQIGPARLTLHGQVSFRQDVPPLRLDNVYSGASSVGLQASVGTAAPLAYILQTANQDLSVDRIDLQIDFSASPADFPLVRAWSDLSEVRPGDTVTLTAVLRGLDGRPVQRSIPYRLPDYLSPGPLLFTFSDASRLNIQEFQTFLAGGALEASELIQAVDKLRRNDGLYLRVWRPGRALRVSSSRLESPPASVRAILESSRGEAAGASAEHSSTLDERLIARFDGVVDGAVQLQIDVKP